MKLVLTYLVFILSFVFNLKLDAQAPSKFYQRFGGNGYDVGNDVKQTLDSGYIVAGATSSFGFGNTDMYLVKLDKMGQVKFQKSFGNYINESAKSIVQLDDSSYVMLGYTNSSGFGGYDMYLVKTDKTGILIWQKNFGGSGWDFGNSLQKTTDGGFIIAGTTYSFGRGNADGQVIKTDALGNVTWSKTYGGVNDDEFKSVIQTADGGYALTGYTKSYLDVTFGDAWIFKLNAFGDSTWCKFYGGVKEDFGNCILELQNSNILISGGTRSSSAGGNLETLIVTYLLTGLEIHSYADISSIDEYYNGVTQNIYGSIANCGTTKNLVTNYDALIDIYTPSYNYVNFFGQGGFQLEEFYSISKTFDNGFVAVGKTTSYSSILEDAFFMKVDSVGNFGVLYTSINENINSNFDEIEIFPNPSNGILNINFTEKIKFQNLVVSIIDLNGKIFYSNKLTNFSNQINLINLSNGFYFVKIYNGLELIKVYKLALN